ncbi:MAG: hypothetical protein QM689_07600 [Oscillospiraceae bacterium]
MILAEKNYSTKAAELTALLSRALDGFLEFERETDALLVCPFEEIEAHMNRRGALSAQIDGVYEELYRRCGTSVMGEAFRDAVANRSERESLPAAAQPVFDAAQKIFTVIHRILITDEQVNARLNAEKQIILKKIRDFNTGAHAQAVKFLSGTSTISHKKYFPPKKTEI